MDEMQQNLSFLHLDSLFTINQVLIFFGSLFMSNSSFLGTWIHDKCVCHQQISETSSILMNWEGHLYKSEIIEVLNRNLEGLRMN